MLLKRFLFLLCLVCFATCQKSKTDAAAKYRVILNQELAKIVFDLRIKKSSADMEKNPQNRYAILKQVRILELKAAELRTKMNKIDELIAEEKGNISEDRLRRALEGVTPQPIPDIRKEQIQRGGDDAKETTEFVDDQD